jgi:hypothetical protein
MASTAEITSAEVDAFNADFPGVQPVTAADLRRCACGAVDLAEEFAAAYNADTDSEGEPYCRTCGGYDPAFGYPA